MLLTSEEELLLIRVRDPDGAIFWVTPGGGMEPGETEEAALQRELREELGLEDYRLGALLWRRHHVFDRRDTRSSQHSAFYAVHVDKFEAVMLDEAEADNILEIKWWKVDELALARDPLIPASLPAIVKAYLEKGAPDPLPPPEVLVDWVPV